MHKRDLDALIAAALDKPVPGPVSTMAEHVRNCCGFKVSAILAYGSCLRGIDPATSLIDLYVLADGYSGMNLSARIGCRLAPPNVYYAECQHDGRLYRAKYAVLPLEAFRNWMSAGNPYFWARFAQPCALLYATDRDAVVGAIATAMKTMYGHALGLREEAAWEAGFRATYATEIRPEGPDRANEIVAANAGFYAAAASALRGTAPIRPNWTMRRMAGKLWSIVRLVKAAFTFGGGADYLAWKIERHSGEKVGLTAWQRRHPIIGGFYLLPRLLKKGAIR